MKKVLLGTMLSAVAVLALTSSAYAEEEAAPVATEVVEAVVEEANGDVEAVEAVVTEEAAEAEEAEAPAEEAAE